MNSERVIQNDIRNALAGRVHAFRANVGQAWTGDAQRLPNGDVLIRNARPFTTGLPNGFSDLFGFKKTLITEADVGTTKAVFWGLEIKAKTGRVSPAQTAFLSAVRSAGGLAGVARSVADAERVLELGSVT